MKLYIISNAVKNKMSNLLNIKTVISGCDFIYTNCNDSAKLAYRNTEQNDNAYTLFFEKQAISFRFDLFYTKRDTLTRVFEMFILHSIKTLLQRRADCSLVKSLIKSITREDLIHLQDVVNMFVNNTQYKRLFQTVKYHFTHKYGILLDVNEGFSGYPPQRHQIFLPPLTIDSYQNDKQPLLFYNEMHVVPIDFRTYNFKKYTTVLNDSPIFNPESNMIFRDVHSDVTRIQSMFIYKKSQTARRSKEATNSVKEYMFLLTIHNVYYQVIAIYPVNQIYLDSPGNVSKLNRELDL